jgi:DNA polymerase-3 subunit gamma/tau
MSTEVWYRKWRPKRFAEVAGQEHITHTLANAVASGRLAHAYLFCGPRGTGKTSTARILAKAANCQRNLDGEPCEGCSNCRDLDAGRALDLVEMDAASNRGIDEIRSLRDKVGYSPTSSMYKIYLIDEVHELTAHAFDALLKTLEEPPPHVIFVLATTEAERVPATIVSRCQRYDFRRIRMEDVVGRLEQVCAGEGVHLPDGAAAAIARRATGSLRDAINLLEQVVAAYGPSPDLSKVEEGLGIGGSEFAIRLVRHALSADLAGAFGVIATARDEGVEPRQLQRSAVERLRALMLVKSGAESSLELGEEALSELRSEGAATDFNAVVRQLHYLSRADFRGDALSPLPLELAVAQAVIEPEPAAPQPTARPTVVSTPPVRRTVREQEPAPGGYSTRPPATTAPGPVPPPASPISPPAPVQPQAQVATQAFVASTGDLTVEKLQALMGTIYDRLKTQRSRASAFINSKCNIMSLEGEQITLAFAHEAVAAKFRDTGGEHINDVEGAIEFLSGKRYGLQVTVDPAVEGWQRAPATARTSHLLDEAEKLGLRRQ